MGLGRLPKAQLRPKGYIMPAARRQLRMDKPPRSLTHGGPWPHANPGRRQQVLKERRQRKRAALAAPATQRKRARVRQNLMHEWKYREAAELSPGAMRRLRGRFLALLRTIQGTHEVGQIQSKLRQSGPDAVRSVRPQRTAQRAGKRSKAKVPPPGGATPQQSGLLPSSVAEVRRESVLQVAMQVADRTDRRRVGVGWQEGGESEHDRAGFLLQGFCPSDSRHNALPRYRKM